jgi:UDP-glucose 4-epimerase
MIEEIRQGNRSAEISVVGGRGFLGGGLVGALSRLDCQVHSFTRQRPFMCDGRLDESILRSEAIFYLATQISPAIAERDPLRVVEENADFRAFLQGLRAARRKPVVVLASSGGTVYDQDCAPPFSERSPTRPTSAYGLAKLAQEAELHASAGWTIPVTLRLGNVYGPGQRTGAGYGVIAHWMKPLWSVTPFGSSVTQLLNATMCTFPTSPRRC